MIRLSNSVITNNNTDSFGNNRLEGNADNGAFSGTTPLE
jgi:hypothetical protein